MNENINKFYDFINMYNSIIKHCSNENSHYSIRLYYIKNKLHLQVSDDQKNGLILHNCELNCTKEESDFILNGITNEFILNHNLKYAAYSAMTENDIFEYRIQGGDSSNIFIDKDCYRNNNTPMYIHRLENTMFSLNIYLYNGIDTQRSLLHEQAKKKARTNCSNLQYVKK